MYYNHICFWYFNFLNLFYFQNLYNRNFLYFQPFVAASILPAMWGVIMCVRTSTLMGLNPKARFISIQLVLIIVKVQVGIAKSLADLIHGPCLVKLHPVVFVSRKYLFIFHADSYDKYLRNDTTPLVSL